MRSTTDRIYFEQNLARNHFGEACLELIKKSAEVYRIILKSMANAELDQSYKEYFKGLMLNITGPEHLSSEYKKCLFTSPIFLVADFKVWNRKLEKLKESLDGGNEKKTLEDIAEKSFRKVLESIE